MRCGTRSVAVVLPAAAALFALIEVTKVAQFGTFENPNPALFARLWPLWSAATAIVPGMSVALLAIRRAPLLSAAAYSAGGMANYIYHYGEWDSPRTHCVFHRCALPFQLSLLARYSGRDIFTGCHRYCRRFRCSVAQASSNNRFERSRGASSMSQGGVDDRDKSASFLVCATPRRSTSSLAAASAWR